MNIKKMFEMQKGLDQHIEDQHQLAHTDLFDRKILALLVELGELANETRCFKFWSVKAPSQRNIILEEFVDGIHFILSLGIECGFETKVEFVQPPNQLGSLITQTEQFLLIYRRISNFQATRSLEDYQELINEFLKLAAILDFSQQEIEQAYIDKNEVNYERQQQGY
jgi:dimeric dUTPase (all-alpha-NTP-PPase superfamily)